MRHVRVRFFLPVVGLLVSSALAFADPPSVVGRLNLAAGPVSFLPGSLDQWAPAVMNYPLSAGDHIWADAGGRAEIHVGSTALRLDSGTEMSFLTLDDQTVQLRLSQGSMNIRVRLLEQGDTWEIDTPNSVITLLQPGSYRVDATPDGEVSVTVRTGMAEIAAGNDVFDVPATSSAHISGFDSVAYYVQRAPGIDPWDAWCASRDAREDRLASIRYVPREMIGIEDLDESGVWIVVPIYGPVWSPTRVPAGWVPYRFGRWAWVAPWGWTWIDDAPWGFTPFHYGRWAFVQSRWVWVPGAIVARPVYAPALVVFVGGSSPDELGWFPLGPREVYVPPYQASTTYVQRLNITTVANITVQVIEQINITRVPYVNRTVGSAVTVLPRQAFVQSRPTSEAALPASSADARRFPVIGMGASLPPQRESVFGQTMNPQRPAALPPAGAATRPVYSRLAPAAPPQPFRPVPNPAAPGTAPIATPPAGRQTEPAPAPQPQPSVIVLNPMNRIQNPPTMQPRTAPVPPTPPGTTSGPVSRPTTTATGQPAPQVQPALQGQVTSTGETTGGPAAAPGQSTGGASAAPRGQAGADLKTVLAALDTRKLPDVEKHLEAAQKTKGIKLDYNALKKRLADIRRALAAAQRDQKAGKDDSALQQAEEIQKQIAEVEKIISDALARAGEDGDSSRQPPPAAPGGKPGQGKPASP